MSTDTRAMATGTNDSIGGRDENGAGDPSRPADPLGAGDLLGASAPVGRSGRIAERRRHPKWQNPPLRIEMAECINCDACLRACPPHFGAIFNHGPDVVIVPELCSGCDKCLPACPVDCIYPFADWVAVGAPVAWWEEPDSPTDPYRPR